MGLFGGDSSSSTTNNTKTQNLSLQGTEGNTFAGVESSTINLTDGGAIEKMFQVTQAALNKGEEASRKAMDIAFKSTNKNTTTETKNSYIMAGTLAAAVLMVYLGKN